MGDYKKEYCVLWCAEQPVAIQAKAFQVCAVGS